MSLEAVPPFASSRVDRDALTRGSEATLAAAWREPGARVLQMRGAEIPLRSALQNVSELALIATEGEMALSIDGGAVGHVYVGRLDRDPVFAVSVAPDTAPPVGAQWVHPFMHGADLSDGERELLAIASGVLRWNESERFSPRDGEPTQPRLGGWARADAHGGEYFPRTDPAVIVLIEHEDRVLLGSNALWETGRFSLLAGFVETGESLEQAVYREVLEESGVRLGEIRYVASQPWPFPRSLMLGFRAGLAEGMDPEALSPDPEEISELRWFTRDQVRTPEPGITLPGGMSIARWMLDAWVAEGDQASASSGVRGGDSVDDRNA